jgi:hypothetical protein
LELNNFEDPLRNKKVVAINKGGKGEEGRGKD